MSNVSSCFVAVVLLLFVVKGQGACTLNDLSIGTVGTGRTIQEKTEWTVSVDNKCACAVSAIKVRCTGLKSAAPLNPSEILPMADDGTCLLNGGLAVGPGASISFSYAWDPPFIFWPASATIGPGC